MFPGLGYGTDECLCFRTVRQFSFFKTDSFCARCTSHTEEGLVLVGLCRRCSCFSYDYYCIPYRAKGKGTSASYIVFGRDCVNTSTQRNEVTGEGRQDRCIEGHSRNERRDFMNFLAITWDQLTGLRNALACHFPLA